MHPLERRTATAALALGFVLLALAARGEEAWIKGEVKLNVRTGPGTEYRIVTTLETGDQVTVLARGDEWSQIRTGDGKEGFVQTGFVAGAPPPTQRMGQLEDQLTVLREELRGLQEEATRLRSENSEIAARDGEQRAAIDALTAENQSLRSASSWPMLVAGASILAIGMIAGAWLRGSGRRGGARLRF
jgi:SH3 domain protein